MNTFTKRRTRQTQRVEATYPVVFLTADGPMEGETKNISTSRVFVRCRDPLRLNDITTMSIKVSAQESLQAEGEVVWSNIYGPDDEITPRGMIVLLTGLSSKNRLRLRNIIARHYRKKLGRIADNKNPTD